MSACLYVEKSSEKAGIGQIGVKNCKINYIFVSFFFLGSPIVRVIVLVV